MPGGRFHWPPKFGYLVSSQACALIGVHRPMATVSAPIMFAARESTPDGLRSIITSSLADEWLAISLALHSVLRAAIDCGTPRRHRRQASSCGAPPSSWGSRPSLSSTFEVPKPAARALLRGAPDQAITI